MINSVIIMLLISSVIYLKSADCAVDQSCYEYKYSLWGYVGSNLTLTNIWCKHQCKRDKTNRYSGTSYQLCYCRKTEIAGSDKKEDKCKLKCPGNTHEYCGNIRGWENGKPSPSILVPTYVTVSKISTPSVTAKESTTQDFMNMITYEKYPAIERKSTPSIIPESSSTTGDHIDMTILTSMKVTQTQSTTVYAAVHQCQTLDSFNWSKSTDNEKVTNIWCEDFCKAASANNRYSGTNEKHCYCGETQPPLVGSRSSDQCSNKCPGNPSENCGGLDYNVELVTISTIGLSTETATVTNTQTTSMSIRESTTAEFTNMNTIVRTPAIETKRIRRRKLLCKCPKRLINTKWHFLDGKNITDAEVKEMVLEDFNKNIKSEISVDKKTVSKEVRKKNSSVNKRKSSQSIGWGCIVFLILPVVFLLAMDILNCCIHFQSRFGDRKRNRIGPISNIKDSRDSSKPMQENVNITESYYASRCGNDFHPDEVKLETYRRRRDDNNEDDRDKWLQYM